MIASLFAGPGGMDAGAEEESVGIEWDEGALATRKAAGLPTMQGDVRNHGPEDVPEADTLGGGPPCQGFSVAGRGEGRKRLALLRDHIGCMAARRPRPTEDLDERSALVLEPLRWILQAADGGRPYRAVVLEQVQQALPVWQTYAEVLRAEGYAAVCGVLSADQHGTPQTRRRAVLLARRDGPVSLPAPTHRAFRRGGPLESERHLRPTVTMRDVLPDRGPFTVISNYSHGGDLTRRGRREHTEPAFTVTGKINRNRLVGPDGTELERFTHAEAGVLQGFPVDYPWSGPDIPQQIGNACPVPLARALFRAVRHG